MIFLFTNWIEILQNRGEDSLHKINTFINNFQIKKLFFSWKKVKKRGAFLDASLLGIMSKKLICPFDIVYDKLFCTIFG